MKRAGNARRSGNHLKSRPMNGSGSPLPDDLPVNEDLHPLDDVGES
jgi:hypothetical protein